MIEISELCKSFTQKDQKTDVLKKISLNIDETDIYGIIGKSGAGKTTLLRILSGLEKPDSGYIKYNESILVDTNTKFNSSLLKDTFGVVFQGYNLLMQSSVFDNVAFPLKVRKENKTVIKEKVEKILKLVGLEEKINAYPYKLSGGQKQRVAIARALVTDPKLLLLDEPTSALDSLTTKAILELIKQIHQNTKVTVLIITHEIGVVKSLCNKVAVLDEGTIVECGDVNEIFNNPKNQVTKLLIGEEE